MKKGLLSVSMLLAVWFSVAQQGQTLSLEQAVEYAMQHQPSFQNYKVDQQIAGAKSLEATSKYLPKVSGSADLRDNLKLGQIVVELPNPLTGEKISQQIQQGTKYSMNAGVDLTQPLLDVSAISDMKAAKTQGQLSAIQLQQAVVDLKVNVARAYYLVLLNQERLGKAEKSVQRFQKASEDAKVKFDNQNALKSEVNRSLLNLSNAKYSLQVAQDSVKTAMASLAFLIGLPADASLTLSDQLPREVKEVALSEYPDFTAAEQLRNELKAETMQQLLARQQLSKINNQYIPTLNGYAFIGGTGLDNKNIFTENKWFWTSYIGLRLNVPIFDGLQKMALGKQQKLQVTKSDNNLAQIRNNILYQLVQSAVNYANSSKNLQLIKSNVTLAEEIVQEATVRYQNGMATFQEVLDAETTLKDTEFNYLQAMYAFLLSELDWKKANGKL
jgi:outer membrane protein TolC